MKKLINVVVILFTMSFISVTQASVVTVPIKQVSKHVMTKFGKGSAGKTTEEFAENAAKIVAKHGDEALPLIRNGGHVGMKALEKAGAKTPDLIKFHARYGDEAVWMISSEKRLALFIKHGDGAGQAMVKHPQIAENLIEKLGIDAVGSLNKLSKTGAQKMGMAEKAGVLNATPESAKLMLVVEQYGDKAMDFIWKHKKVLVTTAVLSSFLSNPKPYIDGTKTLVVEPAVNAVVTPIAETLHWNIWIPLAFAILFLPAIMRKVIKTVRVVKEETKAAKS